MRPLIEILEDERTLTQKQESIYRFMMRHDDEETMDILSANMKKTNERLQNVHDEIREYFGRLLGE